MAQYLFDGMKTVNISSLPEEAWTHLGGGVTGDDADIKTYYIRVPFLSRAVKLCADAVSSLPFSIVNQAGTVIDSSDDYQNKLGFLPNPRSLFSLVESSLFLLGRAYLFRSYNRVKTLGLRYLVPTTISPLFSEDAGLVGFKRQLAHSTMELQPQDLVYFWQLDPYVEIGPGNNSAGMACLSAAGVLYNVDQFATSFFERGAIKVTLLTTKGPIPEPERNRLKAWWGKMFKGKDSAWKMDIVQADAVQPVVLGEGVQELSDSELTKEKREDIAVAAGIPITILWSSEASGLGGGGVVESDDRKFYEQRVVPDARFIEATLNEQVLAPMGLRLVFRPETLDVFQEDESQRAQALVQYVSAGFRLGMAAQILGVELPEGVGYADLDAMQEEDKQAAFERQQQAFEQRGGAPFGQQQGQQEKERQEAIRADLSRWRTKALKAGGVVPFESEYIPPALMESINGAIKELGVEDAFAFLKKKELAEDIRRRVQKKVQPILETYQKKIEKAIEKGDVTDEILRQLFDELNAALAPEISVITTGRMMELMSEVGIGGDLAVISQEALEYARSYTYELVTGLTDTTRELVRGATSTFFGTPGMTRGDLERLLEPAFGPARAQMIAVTEVTRAYSAATNQYQGMAHRAGVEMRRVWLTTNDSLVCPICGPLHGQPESVWQSAYPKGPPAHVNCRCATELTVDTEAEALARAQQAQEERRRALEALGVTV